MATQACTTCRGSGRDPYQQNSTPCQMCDGTGKQFDPGRFFVYEMGPFTLNAPAAVSPTFPQYFVGAASAAATLNGVTCQVTGHPFRWMFSMAKSTFPFTVQIKDAGSGSGRSFCPQQLQVHSRNLFGTSENPLPLATPYVFERNVQITADFTDLGGAVGVCGVTNGSAVVTWESGAYFNTGTASGPPYPGTQNWAGAQINIAGVNYVISSALGSGVASQTSLTLATTYTGTTSTTAAFSVSNTIRVGFMGVELSS